MDATLLKTDEALKEAAERCHVFGRVTPQQKQKLIRAMKEHGHTVAMTGDGVNDVLALKEADCSVAMAAGSDAARNVAQLVLIENDFSAMPKVVAEGRRTINNIQRSSSLFLVKTLFSILLGLLTVVIHMRYPFQPIQMSLVGGVYHWDPLLYSGAGAEPRPRDREVLLEHHFPGNSRRIYDRYQYRAGLLVPGLV